MRIKLSYSVLTVYHTALEILNEGISPNLAKRFQVCDTRKWGKIMDAKINTGLPDNLRVTDERTFFAVITGWCDNYPLKFKMRMKFRGSLVSEVRWRVYYDSLCRGNFFLEGITSMEGSYTPAVNRTKVITPVFKWDAELEHMEPV